MAPLPEWFQALRHNQQVVTSDATFSEKAIVLLVVGHILLLYTVLCWLGAGTVSTDNRDHRKLECLEGQFELQPEPRESNRSRSNDEKHGPSSSALNLHV
ncbi:hypothetical protein PoHVEF18_002927 [Penicillium ochrochloron]